MVPPVSPLHRRLWRSVAVVLAALLAVVPAWTTARSVAAAVSLVDSGAQTAPVDVLEDEETLEAALPRADLEVHTAADRRDERVPLGGMERRHRVEHDAEAAARRWASYRAPPRAPPRRLLN